MLAGCRRRCGFNWWNRSNVCSKTKFANWVSNWACLAKSCCGNRFLVPGSRFEFWARSPDRLEILRNADTVVVEEMKSSGWYYKLWQSFAVLLPIRSVGVMGDERTYDYTIAIRAVESQDGMTADWVKLPYELLEKLSSRIINEVK